MHRLNTAHLVFALGIFASAVASLYFTPSRSVHLDEIQSDVARLKQKFGSVDGRSLADDPPISQEKIDELKARLQDAQETKNRNERISASASIGLLIFSIGLITTSLLLRSGHKKQLPQHE